ncbi:hypothetical protein H5410_057760 [Solanum commersonii]|uniref:Integrase core domain containing protein n=1 Tax=Solanum commersonii TaxID=4109 RepID=A0A9J5WPV4_SOLCO|nr:hypothetical protein H5410_057760 [Solanum commersonii]
MGPSSSRSAPQLGVVVVPLARVQKLEAQMATLLHHIQPWMQKSIAESEARVECKMELASVGVEAILAAPIEPRGSPSRPADDTLLDALFSGITEEVLALTHAKVSHSKDCYLDIQ